MRVLLVEDDRMIAESLRSALRMEGHAVDWVRDVPAAQGSLATEQFDIVLHVDRTNALEPLEQVSQSAADLAETYPSGL